MRVTTFHPVAFEQWDPDTPDTRGIGGSETSQIELSWRLARRGHEVVSYAPVPWKGMRDWCGSQWAPLDEVDFSRDGVWLLYRCPDALDNFSKNHYGQDLWLISQDESYPTWNAERLGKLDRFVALCQAHAESHRRSYPGLGDKIFISSNGIKVDLIREIEKENIPRDPKKLIYASSPDRGLHALLKIFKRAREWCSGLKLDIFYGFDNIDKLIALNPNFASYKKLKDDLLRLAEQPGVTWRGRVDQRQLIREWFSAGIWCHPSMFTETSCITCMDAQACGAIPLTNPVWAVGENVLHGIFVQGDCYNDPLVQARFVGEIYRLATNVELQDAMRGPMMKDARQRFSWERVADQLESWMYGFEHHPMAICQFNFQLKHVNGAGRILNVGCADDPADLKSLGAVNMDSRSLMPDGRKNKPDVVADARQLPAPFGPSSFDCVVLGDILEHFQPDEAPEIIRKAKQVLEPGGKLIITVPEDYRAPRTQHLNLTGTEQYMERISAFHTYPVTEELLRAWLEKAEVRMETMQRIEYNDFIGWGVVVRC